MGGISIAGVDLLCTPCLDCLSTGDFVLGLLSVSSLSWSSARSDFDLPKTGMRFLAGLGFVLFEVRLEAEVEETTGEGCEAAVVNGRWL